MSLRSTALTISPKGPGPRCGISRLCDILEGDDLVWLHEQLTGNLTSEFISDVLRQEGHNISGSIVARHRNRKCACDTA